eukprot:6042217-Lingulodinium_polyedra.AAC.1
MEVIDPLRSAPLAAAPCALLPLAAAPPCGPGICAAASPRSGTAAAMPPPLDRVSPLLGRALVAIWAGGWPRGWEAARLAAPAGR